MTQDFWPGDLNRHLIGTIYVGATAAKIKHSKTITMTYAHFSVSCNTPTIAAISSARTLVAV